MCAACQPSVDDALKRSDQRAQAEAWGRALRRGAMKPDKPGRSLGVVEVGMWRVRGVLWVLDAAMSWGIGLAGTCFVCCLGRKLIPDKRGLRLTTWRLWLRRAPLGFARLPTSSFSESSLSSGLCGIQHGFAVLAAKPHWKAAAPGS